jgi:hypothetical protein
MIALNDADLEIIAGAYRFFILIGEAGSEALLIKALDQYGSRQMAEDFLNCGNSLLEQAAREWAGDHGYTITQGSKGVPGPHWGSGQ